MADDVEVKIGADTAAATGGMDQASASIADSLSKIASALDNFGQKNNSAVNKAIQNNADLSRSFLELKGSVTGGFNGIIGVVERFRGVMGTLTAALAGGILWKESISEMLKMEDSVRSLQITFGMLSSKATNTALALNILGKSGEELSAMGMKVARQIKMNEDGLHQLGVVTRDATGALLPLDEIMQNGFKTMQEYRAGADQDEFALAFFGRTVGDVTETMLRLPAAQKAAIELQKEFGVEMGPARQAEIEAYRISVGRFTTMLGIIGEKIGEAALPSLMRLAAYFNTTGPEAANVFIRAMTRIIAAMDVLGTGSREIAENLKRNHELILADEEGFSNAWHALLTNGIAGAKAAWSQWMKDRERIELESSAKVLGMEAELYKRMALLADNSADQKKSKRAMYEGDSYYGQGGDSPLGSGNKRFPEKTGGDDIVAKWREQLEELKEAQGYFNEYSKAQEAAFWAAKLALVKQGSKEYIEVHHMMYEAAKASAHEGYDEQLASMHRELEAARDNEKGQEAIMAQMVAFVRAHYKEESKEVQAALEEQTRLRQAWAKREQQMVKEATDFHISMLKKAASVQDEYLNGEVAAGRLSADRKIEIERSTEEAIYQAELAELDKEMALLTVGTEAYQKAMQKRLALTVDFTAKELQLAQQAEAEREKYAKEADQAIESSLGTLMDNLVNRTTTLKKAFMDFFNSLDQQLVKIAGNQVMQQLLGPGTGGGSGLSSITSKIFGSGGGAQQAVESANTSAVAALTVALTANTAALQTSSLAGGAGGGWTSGFDLAGGGGLPGFESGTAYVPETSLAIVHKGEAIIPASMNKGGGMSSTSVAQHFHMGGGADTRTLAQISKAAARGVNRATRRG